MTELTLEGHWVYIWSAYAIAAAVFVGNLAVSLWRGRALRRELARRLRQERDQ